MAKARADARYEGNPSDSSTRQEPAGPLHVVPIGVAKSSQQIVFFNLGARHQEAEPHNRCEQRCCFLDVVCPDFCLSSISSSWRSECLTSLSIEFGFPKEPGSKDYCGPLNVRERICHFVMC